MSFFVQTIAKKGKIDDPRHWADGDVTRPPVFNVKEFQKKIDKAIGVSKDGHSIIRLRWAWDMDCYAEYYTDWNIEGYPTKSEFRAKYRYQTVDLGNGDYFEVCPPRWVLEELITPDQIGDAWEVSRWQFNQQINKKVPNKPPVPRTGYYVFYKYIAEHDEGFSCCQRALAADSQCYGVYRKPLEYDILQLRKIKRMIEQDTNRPNPYAPMSEKDLEIIRASAESAERDRFEAEQKAEDEKHRFYSEIVRPLKEYSLPDEKRTASGLILLN